MSIEAFKEAQRAGTRHGNPSWYEIYVPQMTDEQREGLEEALQDPSIGHAVISKVLNDWGYKVKPNSVGHWRRQNVS